MILHIAQFESGHYPEDNHIVGAFSSERLAEEAISRAIDSDRSAYPNHPRRYQQNRLYYRISEFEIDQPNAC